MQFLPHQSQDLSLTNAQSSQLRSAAHEQVAEIEKLVLAGNMNEASRKSLQLCSRPTEFSLAVPRLVSSICNSNPKIVMTGESLLYNRMHWLSAGQLNEIVIPQLLPLHRKSTEGDGAKCFLYALSASASLVDNKFIAPLLELIHRNFYDQQSGNPFIHNAVLAHFCDRLPLEDRLVMYRSVNFALSILTEKLQEDNAQQNFENHADLFGFTLSGLQSISQYYMSLDEMYRQEAELISDIVYSVRTLVKVLEGCLVIDKKLKIPALDYLLLSYPYIDPVFDDSTRETSARIAGAIAEKRPVLSQLIADSLNDLWEPDNLSSFVSSIPIDSNPDAQLEAVSKLNRLMNLPKEFASKKDESDAIEHLVKIEKTTYSTLFAMIVRRAQCSLELRL